MKNYFIGFLTGVGVCLFAYLLWEHHRYVPVIIKEIKVPFPVPVPVPVPIPAPVEPGMRIAYKKAPFVTRGLRRDSPTSRDIRTELLLPPASSSLSQKSQSRWYIRCLRVFHRV